MSVNSYINELKKELVRNKINAEEGLPLELFLMTTTLVPIVNVDLIITNDKNQVLFLWREDRHNGAGWHIPGGCVRFKETINERIHKCAMNELGVRIKCDNQPIAVIENIIDYDRNIDDQNERAHFITLCYHCTLAEKLEYRENIKWFEELPENLIKTQYAYRLNWEKIKKKI